MTFFIGVTKFLTKSNLREKGFILVYSWRGLLQYGRGGVAAGREGMHDSRELAGYPSTTVRKQRKTRKQGWAIKPQVPPRVTHFLPCGFTLLKAPQPSQQHY